MYDMLQLASLRSFWTENLDVEYLETGNADNNAPESVCENDRINAEMENENENDADISEEDFQCPICLDSIREEQGVMRCEARHYYHQACLKQWINHRKTYRGGAKCPMCRGTLQVHAARLRSYLKTSNLSDAERSFITRALLSIQEGADWIYLNQDEIIAYSTIVGGFLWGLYSGWTNRSWGFSDEMLYYGLRRNIRIATSIGWLGGIIGRIVGNYSKRGARMQLPIVNNEQHNSNLRES
uniref:RING-type domain-containing protein n=1 Tax=Aplanochytrium stocchinoi TaxID=215587 RepID=A0A7S3V2B5_9STRA|mmetsp:Transcript_1286/g.1643  ORF Transcript_1286/g.1643 Transcript_1286/m.1643 type:complete len:241 (+) Transcript_1286:250-972(+)